LGANLDKMIAYHKLTFSKTQKYYYFLERKNDFL
jgi:hypothetical protein